jgi:acetyl-CoA carboxylase biotin carboxyl carrier protein
MAGNDASPKPESKGRTLADVRALARILRQYDLSEVEVEVDGAKVALRRETRPAAAVAMTAAVPESVTVSADVRAPEGGGDAAGDDGSMLVTSPFVGTFYRAPSPEAAAFIDAGQIARKGQTLCIVEAMKLMNEIEAECDLKVVAVLAQNGDPVEYGQPLFRTVPA